MNPTDTLSLSQHFLGLDKPVLQQTATALATQNAQQASQLSQVGQYAEAESLAIHGLRERGPATNQWVQLLMAQTAQGHFDAARHTLAEFLKVAGPANGNYLWGRAMLLSLSGPADSAERAWLELGLKSRSPSDQSLMQSGLAFLALNHGRLAEADRRMQADVAVNEKRGLAGSALGMEIARASILAVYRGDSAGAGQVLDRALARHPLESIPPADRPYGELATAYLRMGMSAQARRVLAEYEKAVPTGQRQGNAEWYLARGWLALAEKRSQDAIAEFRLIRTKGQRADWGYYQEGVAWDQLNQPDSALAAYGRAADSAGTGWLTVESPWTAAPALKRMGELYEAKGDKAKAIESYGRLVDRWTDADPPLQPVVREVKERLVKLTGETSH